MVLVQGAGEYTLFKMLLSLADSPPCIALQCHAGTNTHKRQKEIAQAATVYLFARLSKCATAANWLGVLRKCSGKILESGVSEISQCQTPTA